MDYRFIDKDPVVDLIRSAVFDDKREIKDIAAEARVHPNTISRWLYGDTRRPQHFTLMRVFFALGVEIKYIVRATGEELIPRGRN